MSRDECEVTTHEKPEKLRTKESHQENIELINENPHSTLTESKGVRMDCVFNSLDSYQMFDNISIDIMHDLHEGIIPAFLSRFFNFCLSNRIISERDIICKIRDFNYGPLFKKKKPSIISLKKPHLGQSATQSYCIIIHLPFIFYELKAKLQSIWPILEELLLCLQIVMSTNITEVNLQRLETHIERFLDGIILLDGTLMPKMHLLTHYPGAIRKVGPLKHLWTMRFECKHLVFTNAAKKTNNFKNIKRTLAMKHQQQITIKKFSIKDDIEESQKPTLVRDHCDFSKYESFLCSIDKDIDFDHLFILPFLKFNNYIYKTGFILIDNSVVYDIIFVLKSKKKYYFLCEIYETKKFERSLNSIQIEPYCPEKKLAYVELSNLLNLQPFLKQICNEKIYVIAENLTVLNSFNESA